MRRMIFLIAILFSTLASADIQQRMAIFTQQSELFRQVCFLPDGTFLEDRILFDVNGSIEETSIDCNAQALALDAEQDAIEAEMQSPNCPADSAVSDQGLISLLNGTSPVVTELTCPGIGNANDCTEGLACNLLTAVIPSGVAAARFAFPDSPLLRSCAGTGNCFSNIGKAIWDNLWDTVTGLYNLASMGVSWVGNQIGSLWAAEDQTSNRAIAATEVSDSQLDQFIADPIGYIYNFGKNLINHVIEGISSRYGCAEWTGAPHFSECVRPMSWECANCNEKLNMFCGVAGYIGANFITNFFTGGALAAGQIASKIAASTVFQVARNIPGAARLVETMGIAARLGRVGEVVSGTIRATWAGLRATRVAQGIKTVAGRLRSGAGVVNGFARKKVFLFAQGQDLTIAAVRGYTRLTKASYAAGYRATGEAANRTRDYLYSLYPRVSDITAGRYARVSNPDQYLREATRGMSAEDRSHMSVTVTRDSSGNSRVVIHDNRPGTISSDISVNFNPQVAAPVVVARAPAAVAPVEMVAEDIVVTARRRPRTQVEFVERYSTRTSTTVEENETYIVDALRSEQPGTFYLDTQNTAMKRLNDTLRDKTIVDSLGNRYNQLVMDAVEDFRELHPGVTVNFYSDYKSMRASIRGPPGQEEALMRELGIIIDRTDETFLAEVRTANVVDPTLLTERWFRAGLGRTADEANLVTRFSRREADVSTQSFATRSVSRRISNAWSLAEQSRRDIIRRFWDTPLIRRVDDTNIWVPPAEVLEVVRKNESAQEIARILSGRFNRSVSVADAEALQRYFTQIDQFSPGLLIASRVEHRFDEAIHGGLSIDFAGVGSVNAEATAIGIASSRNVREAIANIRQREILVTRDLDALKLRTETAVRDVLRRHNITAEITVSGDDMLVVPNRALTPEIRTEIAEAQVRAQVGTSTPASGMRTSFFNEGIPEQAARSIQATIGESVEKQLRKYLEGRIPQSELRDTLFAVEMRGTSPGTGGVGLTIVNPNLPAASRAIIERELRNAVETVNRELRANGQVGDLTSKIELPESRVRLFAGDIDPTRSPRHGFGLGNRREIERLFDFKIPVQNESFSVSAH